MPRGPAPTPGSRNQGGTFDWVRLVKGRRVEIPKLPDRHGGWSTTTLLWWAELWELPQAQAWEPSGRTLHDLAELREVLNRTRVALADDPDRLAQRVSQLRGQMQGLEDRHGLNPKSLLQLRWIVVDDEGAEVALPPTPGADDLEHRRATRRKRMTG